MTETIDDNGLGLAAQLAYYFFLALFPALLFLLAVASFFSYTDLAAAIVSRTGAVLPGDAVAFIKEQLSRIAGRDQTGLLTLGFAGALWSTSTAVVAIIGVMNRAYDVEETRAWWRVRLLAVGLTMMLATGLLVASATIISGGDIYRWIGLPAAAEVWPLGQWAVALGVVIGGLTVLYRFAADVDQGWAWCWPGALLATALWLLASGGFRLYVSNFTSYTESYGAVGSVIVLLLWLYLLGLAIVSGAELNSEIEHASRRSDAKRTGEKTPSADVRTGDDPPTNVDRQASLVLGSVHVRFLEGVASRHGLSDIGTAVRCLVDYARDKPEEHEAIFAPEHQGT